MYTYYIHIYIYIFCITNTQKNKITNMYTSYIKNATIHTYLYIWYFLICSFVDEYVEARPFPPTR